MAALAEAPKSTRAYQGYSRAEKLAKRDLTLLVPVAMRDVPVGVADVLERGEGYKYPPEYMCVLPPYSSLCQTLMTQRLS